MVTLRNKKASRQTVISNRFIDCFMPSANGEFVKVYLYLLRLLTGSQEVFSLELLADQLHCTERDVLRALRYWEETGLLELTTDEGETPTDIILLPLPEEAAVPQSAAPVAVAEGTPEKTAETSSSLPPASAMTADRLLTLKQNEAVAQLLFVAQQYLARPLSATETRTLLYFYDILHMSADLIEYLIEYCIGRNHKSIRYMEKVALSWVEEGITTVAMAKEASTGYQKEYYRILKALGITGRVPVREEVELMKTWTSQYGFDLTLIQEACSRTVMTTGSGSFHYTDKILTGWKKKGVKSLEDVKALDEEHRSKRKAKPASSPERSSVPASNRFNNFNQRTYDYRQFEQQLLSQPAQAGTKEQ